MPTKKKATAVKTRYAVMIPRHQVFCFEVEAKSAEDACNTLWRKLRLDNNPVSPADAKAAQDPGLGWIGSVTGASQAHGSALIVIADRKKADPNGRTINRLMKLAPN